MINKITIGAVALLSLVLSSCAPGTRVTPVAAADGSVGYSIRAYPEIYDPDGMSEEAVVRKFIERWKVCPGAYAIQSMRRYTEYGSDQRPWVDAIIQCRT